MVVSFTPFAPFAPFALLLLCSFAFLCFFCVFGSWFIGGSFVCFFDSLFSLSLARLGIHLMSGIPVVSVYLCRGRQSSASVKVSWGTGVAF